MVRTATLTAVGLVLALGGTAAAQQAGGGVTGGATGGVGPAAGGGIAAGTSTATGAGIGTGTGAGIGTGTGAGIGTGTGAGLTGTGAGAGVTTTGALTGTGTAMSNPLPDLSVPNGNTIAVPAGPQPDGTPPESRVVVPDGSTADTTGDTATGQRGEKLPGEPLNGQPGAEAAVPINPLTTGVGGDVVPKTVRVGSGARQTNGAGAPAAAPVTRSADGAVTGMGAGGSDESDKPNVIAVPYQK